MRSAQSLHPVALAAADLGVGAVLYQELSAVLGSLLLIVGLLVLSTIAATVLYHGGAGLRQRIAQSTVE